MTRMIFITLFLLHGICSAEEITGIPRLVDGDSIRIADVDIRLHGIDAPEAKQLCLVKGDDWACGETATKALKKIIGKASIRCEWKQRDRFERALGTCYRDGHDIGELMVERGLAVAYTGYSGKYIMNQEEAKKARKGLWGAQFIPPWDWRRGVRLSGDDLPDNGCEIKGNVNRKGNKIYHIKGWRDHAKVRLKAEEGDQCFRSVFDAEMAGFRPAQQ